MVLDPVVAQAVGAGDQPAVARAVQRGVIIAALLTVPAVVLLTLAAPVFSLARQPAEVIPLAAAYAIRTAPGTFPFLLFVVFRQSLQAMGRTAPIVGAIIGRQSGQRSAQLDADLRPSGLPGHGRGGIGLGHHYQPGSAGARPLGSVAGGSSTRCFHPSGPRSGSSQPLARMFRLGIPIGAQHVLEFGAFALVALMMGWMGTQAMAGHQVAINLAALTFMVPLGVGDAASVLVGQAVGRGDPEGTRGAARAAFACGVAFMAMTGAVFLSFPEPLARLYSRDLGVIGVAATLIPIAGVFQIFDGIQVVASGVLRGLGDTRAPMVANLLGYWLVGIPVSIYLGFVAGLGPVGLWWGLVLGLGLVGTSLLLRVRTRLARRQARVLIDSPLPRRRAARLQTRPEPDLPRRLFLFLGVLGFFAPLR